MVQWTKHGRDGQRLSKWDGKRHVDRWIETEIDRLSGPEIIWVFPFLSVSCVLFCSGKSYLNFSVCIHHIWQLQLGGKWQELTYIFLILFGTTVFLLSCVSYILKSIHHQLMGDTLVKQLCFVLIKNVPYKISDFFIHHSGRYQQSLQQSNGMSI